MTAMTDWQLTEAKQIAENTPVEQVVKAFKQLEKQPESDFWLKVKGFIFNHNIKKVTK